MQEQTVYGISHLSIVPVRLEPLNKGELGTQLLFGDTFSIIKYSEDKKWILINVAYDNYQGWIDFKQFKEINKEFYEELNSSFSPICIDLIGGIKNEKRSIPIVFGSIVPFCQAGIVDFGYDRFQFDGRVMVPSPNLEFKYLEKIAKTYLGAPYLWGGKTHFGIDCSGFIQQVFKICGYKLPRDSYQQAELGEKVEFEKCIPGDLAFFNDAKGRVIHIGIILENNLIIHASGEVRIDRLDEKGIFNQERNTYSHKLCFIKRILSK